jgi:hypothetical protein
MNHPKNLSKVRGEKMAKANLGGMKSRSMRMVSSKSGEVE